MFPFFRQLHHLMNSSSKTHGPSNILTYSYQHSSTVPHHQASFLITFFQPKHNNNHEQSIIPKSLSQVSGCPTLQVPKSPTPLASCPTSPCSTWPPRCCSPRFLRASPCARPWPRWKQRRNRRRSCYGGSHEGMTICQFALEMGSDLEPKDDCHKKWKHLFEAYFFPCDPIWVIPTNIYHWIGAWCSKFVGCVNLLN